MDSELRVETRRRGGAAWKARAERIQKGLEVLDNGIDTIHSRIDPVLRPEAPSPALGGVPSDPDATSELGGWLDNVERRLDSLGMRLSSLSERVDL
jgi:hypothetical protein